MEAARLIFGIAPSAAVFDFEIVAESGLLEILL